MQFHLFALLFFALLAHNGVDVPPWIWVVSWVLTILRAISLTIHVVTVHKKN